MRRPKPDAPLSRTGRARWRFVRALAWLALLAGLAPFVWALGFCFPRGDDFDEVTRAMFLFDLPGGLYEVGREWLTWSGRYTYHFLAVFLGKAGELRFAAGLMCGAVLALHGAAFYGFARAAGVARRDAAPLALLAVLTLCACTGFLPGFYLLTDALTTGLQSAAALLFFWSLCALWQRCAASAPDAALRRSRRLAILLGVLGVGVFEHAALAVLSGAAIACALAWFHDRRGQVRFAAGRFRVFLGVGLWCAGALLFSFLAPGNFARRAVRGIDAETVGRQLAALPGDWLHALGAFAGSLWPAAALLLVLLLLFLRRREKPVLARPEALLLAALCPTVFCLFSFALGALHAASDMPLPSHSKLAASLGLYAACALGFTASALLDALPALTRPRPLWALLTGAVLLGLCLAGGNFQGCLRAAVNGDMALYAETMERRDAWLRHEGAKSPWQGKFRFGLAGEVLYPGSRVRTLRPGAPVTLVCQWRRPVPPVWSFAGLPPKPSAWPNQWVAWMYGLEAVASARPSPAPAVGAVFGRADAPGGAPDGPLELRLPPEARRLGLTGAWRVNAQGGPNPTFALDWLVLESEKALPKQVAVLAPSPLSRARMAPLFVQAWLLRAAEAGDGALALWSGPELAFHPAAWRVKGAHAGMFRYAFPLGPAAPLAQGASEPGEWPAGLFLRLTGAGLLQLAPAGAVLDSGLESG
ncbi:MAG: hypothetical protein HDR50_10480 [Desulfovibrio sp.]|uniref:hypothetical protein n=1 Tax=Desulfovibrio sp. TaxID=885 RepID=UPI001A6C4A13|nr:hypothetical protein [Desulfovibrio sp.]MBD5418051.1 hypothetical protein [Desulfovibrio sp.]